MFEYLAFKHNTLCAQAKEENANDMLVDLLVSMQVVCCEMLNDGKYELRGETNPFA